MDPMGTETFQTKKGSGFRSSQNLSNVPCLGNTKRIDVARRRDLAVLPENSSRTNKTCLELKRTSLKWMFGETIISLCKDLESSN